MYLLDTNIFLEILLQQDKSEECKKFITKNIGNLCLSDFSLHSIGVILFRLNKYSVFSDFSDEILTNLKLESLPIEKYKILADSSSEYDLDFDDVYQFMIAKVYDYTIVTMDKDFNRVSKFINILNI